MQSAAEEYFSDFFSVKDVGLFDRPPVPISKHYSAIAFGWSSCLSSMDLVSTIVMALFLSFSKCKTGGLVELFSTQSIILQDSVTVICFEKLN